MMGLKSIGHFTRRQARKGEQPKALAVVMSRASNAR